MRGRRVSAAGGAAARGDEATGQGPGPGPGLDSQGIDELGYVADMLAEMAQMTARLGAPTLTGLLAVARSEADLEQQRRRAASGLLRPPVA